MNILSGINGVGKTTILNRSVGYLEQLSGDIQLSGEMKSDAKNGVHLFFDNPAATYIPYDVIRSYDRPLIMGDFTARMADKNVKSELDWQLYLLQRRYLDYQVNIGNKMIEMLSSNDEEQRSKAATLSLAKRRFQDMIDELFSYTRKKIDLLCAFHGRAGSLPAHRMATETDFNDPRTESQCANHSDHPFACRHHGGLAGCSDRGERYFHRSGRIQTHPDY